MDAQLVTVAAEGLASAISVPGIGFH